MSTGEPIRVRAAMKPFSTVPKPLATVDLVTGEPGVAIKQRTDVCAVPAGGVVGEAVVAFVLAERGAGEVRGRLARPRRGGNLEHYRGDACRDRVPRGDAGSREDRSSARSLPARLGVPFLDLDLEIERRPASSVSEIFAAEGEAAFRALEARRS